MGDATAAREEPVPGWGSNTDGQQRDRPARHDDEAAAIDGKAAGETLWLAR